VVLSKTASVQKLPSRWIEKVKKGTELIFPDLNYIIYDEDVMSIKTDGIEDILFEESFIFGKFMYLVMVFAKGSIELSDKDLNSKFFFCGGPKDQRKEKVLKTRKVLKVFTVKSSSWKLMFETEKPLDKAKVFEKAYNDLKERFTNFDEILQKFEEMSKKIDEEIQEEVKKRFAKKKEQNIRNSLGNENEMKTKNGLDNLSKRQ